MRDKLRLFLHDAYTHRELVDTGSIRIQYAKEDAEESHETPPYVEAHTFGVEIYAKVMKRPEVALDMEEIIGLLMHEIYGEARSDLLGILRTVYASNLADDTLRRQVTKLMEKLS